MKRAHAVTDPARVQYLRLVFQCEGQETVSTRFETGFLRLNKGLVKAEAVTDALRVRFKKAFSEIVPAGMDSVFVPALDGEPHTCDQIFELIIVEASARVVAARTGVHIDSEFGLTAGPKTEPETAAIRIAAEEQSGNKRKDRGKERNSSVAELVRAFFVQVNIVERLLRKTV
jgi:hypothetical protein